MKPSVFGNGRRLIVGSTGLRYESLLAMLAAGESREALVARFEGLTARDIDETVAHDRRLGRPFRASEHGALQ